jgi:hypothetical protein
VPRGRTGVPGSSKHFGSTGKEARVYAEIQDCLNTGQYDAGLSADKTAEKKELVSHPERRREMRFPLRHPAILNVSAHGVSETEALTENVSAYGIFLFVDLYIPQGTKVAIVLKVKLDARRIRLVYEGTVVRSERLHTDKFAVAVGCERPVRITSEES